MRPLHVALALPLMCFAFACSAPPDESTDSNASEASEAEGRSALLDEVRIVVQKDASSEKLCVVYEAAFGKLKASRCAAGGPPKVGSDKCLLGGDGCWRVGRTEAWRAVRAEGGALVDLIHLDGARLSPLPGDDATVSATRERKSLVALVDGHLTTPMSGSRSPRTPASEWCVTLEERGGDAALGLVKFHEEGAGARDYQRCAVVTLEPAKQIYAPLPAGMRAGDDCGPAALDALGIASDAPAGAAACHQGGMACVNGRWQTTTCADLARSSRSFCSRRGFCDASMSFPAEDAPCRNPTDADDTSCGIVLGGAEAGNTELTCQDGFWRKQSCASLARSSRSHCADTGRCASIPH